MVVAEAIRNILQDSGHPMVLLDVNNWHAGKYRITVLRWQQHGIAHRHEFDVEIDRDADTVAAVTPLLELRLDRMLDVQMELAAMHGTPHAKEPHQVDVSRLSIDRPLAAFLRETYRDGAINRLRRSLAAGPGVEGHALAASEDRWIERASETIGDVGIEVTRLSIRAKFTIRSAGLEIGWSKGGVSVKGLHLPETMLDVLPRMKGQGIGALISHPLLDPTMTITNIGHVDRSRGPRISLVVKDCLIPVSEAFD